MKPFYLIKNYNGYRYRMYIGPISHILMISVGHRPDIQKPYKIKISRNMLICINSKKKM